MKLHELKEGKIYIGEDGKEYRIIDNHLCYLDGVGATVASRLSTLTQYFTLKKVKRTVEERVWVNKYPYGCTSYYYKTREEADGNASANRIACIEMVGTYEIEEEEED